MEDLKNIIKEIQGYREELGLKNLSDDAILTSSVSIFNQGYEPEDVEERATKKQIGFLRQLGYKGSEDISKFEATEIIEKLKKHGS